MRNQAGEDFLGFCEINQLSIMNTWFQKSKQKYGTWMYPGTRCSSMIDFVVVYNGHR